MQNDLSQMQSVITQYEQENTQLREKIQEQNETVQLLKGKYEDSSNLEVLRDRNLHHTKIQMKNLQRQVQ